MFKPWLVAVVIIAAPAGAQTQSAPPKQISAVQDCRSIADPGDRLACYDRAVDALTKATTANELVIVDRGEVKEARRGLFGFNLPKIGFLSGDGKADADEDKLVAKVISSRRFRNDQWRFTIEGGATWETTEVSRGFDDPVPGATVTIERGTLGAYNATVGKRGRAKVRRVQ